MRLKVSNVLGLTTRKYNILSMAVYINQEKYEYVSIANEFDRITVLGFSNSCYVLSLPTDIATIPRAPLSN